jgi:predicted O-linked N-acetylglucosamine transferase (SPINDLY family)
LIDALRHPHPIVTVPGQTMRSRHGSAIFHTLGMGRLVCDDVHGYIETAVALGRDVAYRAEVRAALAAGLGRLQDTEAVRALERHLIAACKA